MTATLKFILYFNLSRNLCVSNNEFLYLRIKSPTVPYASAHATMVFVYCTTHGMQAPDKNQ